MYIEKELRERLVRDLGLEMGFVKMNRIFPDLDSLKSLFRQLFDYQDAQIF